MSYSKLYAFAVVVLLSLGLFAPATPAHADTYQIIPLFNETEGFFYGMNDLGYVAISVNNSYCPPTELTCYETVPYGNSPTTATPPNLAYDFSRTSCVAPQPFSSPCSITFDGRTAAISVINGNQEILTVAVGNGAPQTLYSTGFGYAFAINGAGDIAFDDGFADEWQEAIDLNTTPLPTPAPEPSSLILLGTGLLGGTLLVTRRRSLI
jgi:PEP-CTERM motif